MRKHTAQYKKIQSAMEYLMTYGWAILVIAVVLGVLYSLGIFSPSNFAPKAQPGSCQVFRPNGPGTSYDANLEGTCSGELPEYTVQFSGNNEAYINISNSQLLNPANITVAFWAKSSHDTNMGFLGKGPQPGQVSNEFYMYGRTGFLQCVTPYGTQGWIGTSYTNTWYFLTCSYNSTATTVYVNGIIASMKIGSNSIPLWSNSYNFVIGIHLCCGNFNGSMADLQIYNVSLNQNSINALYQEGIGGVPTSLQNLIAWYPLNGNANDYSGNNNDGIPYNVLYTATWQSGYTAP